MDFLEYLDIFPVIAIIIVIVVLVIVAAVKKASNSLKDSEHGSGDEQIQINSKFFGESNIHDRLKEYKEKKAAQSAEKVETVEDTIEVEGEPMISVLELDEEDYKSTARAIVWGEILATPKCKSIGRRR